MTLQKLSGAPLTWELLHAVNKAWHAANDQVMYPTVSDHCDRDRCELCVGSVHRGTLRCGHSCHAV